MPAKDQSSYEALVVTALQSLGPNPQEALRLANQVVEVRPKSADSHNLKGLALMATGRIAEAIEAFRRAVEINPRLASAWHNLGTAYERDFREPEAEKVFRRAIAIDRAAADSYLHLGFLQLRMGFAEEALETASKAVHLVSNSAAATHLFQEALWQGSKGEGWARILDEALRAKPNSAYLHAVQGMRLQEVGQLDEGRGSLKRSVELEPRQGLAYFCLIQSGEPADIELVEKAAAIKGLRGMEARYLQYALGQAADRSGRYEEAMVHFDHAAQVLRQGEGAPSDGTGRSSFTKELFDRHRETGLDSRKPIFIVGMMRSGTTLVEQILSRHTRIGAAGELTFWDNHKHALDPQATPDFDRLRRVGRQYLDLLDRAAPLTDRVTDKMPTNFEYLGLLHLVFPNARFIHVRRHPVDTCISIYSNPFSPNAAHGGTRSKIVAYYRYYLELMDYWRSVFPAGALLEIEYEALVGAQEKISRGLIEALELEWEEACLTPEKNDRLVRTMSVGQVRRSVYSSSVGRWRNYEPWLGEFAELL